MLRKVLRVQEGARIRRSVRPVPCFPPNQPFRNRISTTRWRGFGRARSTRAGTDRPAGLLCCARAAAQLRIGGVRNGGKGQLPAPWRREREKEGIESDLVFRTRSLEVGWTFNSMLCSMSLREPHRVSPRARVSDCSLHTRRTHTARVTRLSRIVICVCVPFVDSHEIVENEIVRAGAHRLTRHGGHYGPDTAHCTHICS